MPLPMRSLLLVAVFVRMRTQRQADVSAADLAKRCGVCTATVYRWMSSDCNSGSALKLEQALRALGGTIKIANARPVVFREALAVKR